MNTPDLDRLIVRAMARIHALDLRDRDKAADQLCEAIAKEDEADVLHESAEDLHLLGDRIDRSVSQNRGG